MLAGLVHGFQCCQRQDETANAGELRVVQLTSDVLDHQLAPPVHLLTRQDSFDAMATPRSGSRTGTTERVRAAAATPRQQSFRDRVRLPQMRRYPVPPQCSAEDSEERRRSELLRTYREFVSDLHKGVYLTQLTPSQDYSDIHCQILEDLQTLKVNQGSGCIIEFPLCAVSRVYRIVKNDDKWHSAGSLMGPTPMPPLPLSNAEHIVVVEFMRRKLAFVFGEMEEAQRFLMCMELLIRRAQESARDQPPGNEPVTHLLSGHVAACGPGEALGQRIRPTPAKVHDDAMGIMCRPLSGGCACEEDKGHRRTGAHSPPPIG